LKCSGVLETVRIRSSGYKNRMNFIDFIKTYLYNLDARHRINAKESMKYER